MLSMPVLSAHTSPHEAERLDQGLCRPKVLGLLLSKTLHEIGARDAPRSQISTASEISTGGNCHLAASRPWQRVMLSDLFKGKWKY